MPVSRAVRACRDIVAGLTRYRGPDVVEEAVRCLHEALRCDASLLLESAEPAAAVCRFSIGGDDSLHNLSCLVTRGNATHVSEPVICQDYLVAPDADPVLSGWGARTVAILPLDATGETGASLLLLWRNPRKLPADFQKAIDPLWILPQALFPRERSMRKLEEDHERLSGILETIPEAVAFVDDNGDYGWINHLAASLLGLNSGTVGAALLSSAMARLRESAVNEDEIRFTAERMLQDPNLTITDWLWELRQPWRALSVSSRVGRFRNVEGRIWVFADVTAQRAIHQALADSQRFSEQILSITPSVIYVYDVLKNSNLYVNGQVAQLLGFSPIEIRGLGDFITRLCHPDDLPRLADPRLRCGEEEVFETEFRARHADGSWRWLRLRESLFQTDAEGRVTQVLGVASDITGRMAIEAELREQEQRWQLALEGSNDGIWDWNAVTGAVFYSARWKEMLGFEVHELADRSEVWEQLVHPEDLLRVKALVQEHLNRATPEYTAEYRIRRRDGEYIWVLARGRAVWDAAGNPLRMVGAHADITERKQAEAQLSYQAAHDVLTGLPNRRHFLELMQSTLAEAGQSAKGLTLCVCDVDHFKLVNDTHGHAIGDEVLVSFARILRDGVRRQDIVARMGGDEFYVLFADATLAEAALSLDRIRERWAAMTFCPAGGSLFRVTSTFGAAALHEGMTAKALVEAADQALYRAKQSGRNRVGSLVS